MKKAFTIIELLVVISVLVILLGIAIPRFKGMQDAARIAQAKAELQSIQSAVESYYTNFPPPKAYPPSVATIGQTYLAGTTPALVSTTPPYDPFAAGNTEYNYRLAADGKYYVLSSVGANAGGSVAIVNGGTVTVGGNALCVTNGAGC